MKAQIIIEDKVSLPVQDEYYRRYLIARIKRGLPVSIYTKKDVQSFNIRNKTVVENDTYRIIYGRILYIQSDVLNMVGSPHNSNERFLMRHIKNINKITPSFSYPHIRTQNELIVLDKKHFNPLSFDPTAFLKEIYLTDSYDKIEFIDSYNPSMNSILRSENISVILTPCTNFKEVFPKAVIP